MNINLFLLAELIILLYILNKKFELKNFLNPFIIFIWFHTVFLFIGLFYATIYERAGIFISDKTKYFILYSFFSSIIGAFYASFIFKYFGLKYKKIETIIIIEKSKVSILGALLIFIFGVSLAFYFTAKIGGFIWLKGNIENLRIEARQGIGFVSILSITSVTYASLYLLLSRYVALQYKIIMFILSSFSLLSFGQRAPFLKWLLLLFLIYLIKNRKKFKLTNLLVWGFSLYFLMIILGILRKGIDEIMTVLIYRLPWRPFVNIYNLDIVLKNIPQNMDYLVGKGYLIDLITVLPGYSPNFGTWLKGKLGLEFEGGSITISYIGDAYANFGLLGIIFFPFLYGFILMSIYILFVKNEIKLDKLIFLALISIGIGASVNTGFMGPILYNILPIIFFYVLHKILNSFYKQMLIKNRGVLYG